MRITARRSPTDPDYLIVLKGMTDSYLGVVVRSFVEAGFHAIILEMGEEEK